MWKYVNSSSETVSLSVVTVIESMEQVCSSCRTGPGAAPANTLCPTQRHTVSPQPLLQLLTPKASLRQVWCPATFQLGFLLLWLLGTRNIHSPGVLNQVYSPALSSDPSDMFSPLKEDFRFVAGCWGTGGFSSPSLSVCECSKEQSYTFCCWCPQPSWGRVGLCWAHVSVCVCVCVMSVCRVSGCVCGCLLTAPVQVNMEGSWWVCAAFPWAGKLQVVSPWAKWNPSIFDSEHHSFAELDVEWDLY